MTNRREEEAVRAESANADRAVEVERMLDDAAEWDRWRTHEEGALTEAAEEIAKERTEVEEMARAAASDAKAASQDRKTAEEARDAVAAVEEAIDVREAHLREGWKRLREDVRGSMGAAAAEEEEAAAAAAGQYEVVTAPADISIADLQRRRAAAVEREGKLQRWAMALERTMANNASIAAQVQKSQRAAD